MAKKRSGPGIGGPMTDTHLDRLNALITACEETGRYCEKCKRCELDVTPEARKNDEQLRIARNIKREWFPDQI